MKNGGMRCIPPFFIYIRESCRLPRKVCAAILLAFTRVILYDNSMSDFTALWPQGPLYRGEPFGTDALALAAFAGERGFCSVCDLGCGSGILLLLLAQQQPGAKLRGVEKRESAAEQCRANLAANGWDRRGEVLFGDVAEQGPGDFELVLTNPPYFPDRPSADAGRAQQRTESMPIGDWCAGAARLLKNGGDCCVVYPTERIMDLLLALRQAKLEPKELRFVAHAPGKAPTLLLCRARKGGKPGLTVRPTLYQTDGEGRETDEYRKICHWEAM